MAKQEKEDPHNEAPEWLKTIQIYSWEAELLISALLLYMLFQVPEFIDEYRFQHYNPGDYVHSILGVFKKALEVLRIGYIVHIIARGIWVASVGLSYIFPHSLNLQQLKFKGKFKKELENDIALDKTVKNLEKVASLSYAISFMISGMLISGSLVLIYFIALTRGVIAPAFQSGNVFFMVGGFIMMILYSLIVLVVFVDFITNGFFRRESSTAKMYYKIALVFRFMTLSFIYNRINLTIISNLKRWQGHLVPILAVGVIAGYIYLDGKTADWDKENYLETSFDKISRMNYENLRKPNDPLFATIQNDVIQDNVVRLFINTHGYLGRFYTKESGNSKDDVWDDLNNTEKGNYANEILKVLVDDKRLNALQWKDYKHPISYDEGFLNYLDISKLEVGMHNLTVEFDTTILNELQLRVIEQSDLQLVKLADIDFYKSE